jgi:LemA protein
MSVIGIVVIVVLALVLLLAIVVAAAHGRLTTLQHDYQNVYGRVDEQFAARHEIAAELLEGDAAVAVERAEAARARVAAAPGEPEAAEALRSAEEELLASLEGVELLPEDAEKLAATGDRLAFASEIYNETVERYSRYRGKFPGSFVARLFGFPEARPVAFATGSR